MTDDGILLFVMFLVGGIWFAMASEQFRSAREWYWKRATKKSIREAFCTWDDEADWRGYPEMPMSVYSALEDRLIAAVNDNRPAPEETP